MAVERGVAGLTTFTDLNGRVTRYGGIPVLNSEGLFTAPVEQRRDHCGLTSFRGIRGEVVDFSNPQYRMNLSQA